MTEESKNNQNNQPTEEQQPSDETQTELREISDEELKRVLEDHKKWLESDGKEGEQADLRHANLKKKDLKNANLKKANLSGANLQKAVLYEADLQKAGLRNANLQKAGLMFANLQKADLFEANLQKADLEGANLEKAMVIRANLQKAQLYEANLKKANLNKADLQKTDLYDAHLPMAYLSEANLQKAELHNADLQSSDLTRADMRKAVLDGVQGLATATLQYTNLVGATGLLGNEFAQADVTGSKLPDDIKEFKALETVEKTSQNARKIFFAMLLGCVYFWLTIATTTDVRLLTNTASSPLPIIGTEIPIAGFYFAAPLVLMCLYFYFHLYLDNLWGALAGLPAIFPDGKRLDERAYPWLLNTLVRRHFKRLKNRPLIARMKEWITIFLAWAVVPITMIAFWLRYIPRHDWVGTCFHIGLIVLSVTFAIYFYRLSALTLQGKEKIEFRLHNFRRDRRFHYGLSVFVVAVLFSFLSYGAIEGERSWFAWGKRKIIFYKIEEVVPWTFYKLGYDVFADFSEKRVSEIPPNYGTIAKGERLDFVKGAKLKGKNLKYSDMYEAFLVKADLRGAFLNNATLQDSILQKANLEYANLQEANLNGANLQEAILNGANLQQAYLNVANLQQATIYGANLQQAYLQAANLQEAILNGANLQEADLMGANLQKASFYNVDLTGAKNLTVDQLSKVKTLYQAKLDPELLEQVKKCCPHLLEKPKEKIDKTN